MDSNNRQQSILPEKPPAAIAGGDWRSQFTKDVRKRIIIRIINTLKPCLPSNGQQDLQELQKVAIRFEEMSFITATDRADYLRKISSKMSSIDSRKNVHTNAMPSNSAGMDRNPQDPESRSITHQQRLDSKTHVGQLPQQQPLLESQSGTMPECATLLSGDEHQQSQQLEMRLPMPSQMAQLQHQTVSQKQINSLESNMQQKVRTSNPLLLQKNVIEQQKTSRSQRSPAEASSTVLDSIAHNGNSGDWQEEAYQKIKDMKEKYFVVLSEFDHKICIKLQQLGSPSDPKKVEKLKYFKKMLEGFFRCLQATKHNILQYDKDKLQSLEKSMLAVIRILGARNPGSPMPQGQLPPTHMQTMQKAEQPDVRIPQIESHDGGINSQLQLLNVQGSSVSTLLPKEELTLQGSVSPAVISPQQKMTNPLQPGSNLGLRQVSTPTSIQQNPVRTSQKASISYSARQIGMNSENSKVSSLQPTSSVLQSQNVKQQHEQQMVQQRRQLKEPFLQQHIHQQLQQTPQKHQPQQHMQQVKQEHGQLQGHQISQLQQLSDANALKTRQHNDIKPHIIVQNLSQGQKYPHQQLKPRLSFPNSSLQSPQAPSPLINQQSSPSVVPSPAPLAPSSFLGDPKNHSTTVSSVSNASSIIHQQARLASPLPEESLPDIDGNTLNIPGRTSVRQQPLERLLKVVKAMSSKTLNASVCDIGSVVSVIDRIGGCSPGDGSRAAVAEDLAAGTNYHLQARNWITQDGSIGMKRMIEHTNSVSLDATSSVGSPTDTFKQLTGSDVEFATASCVKRPRVEINPDLSEELRKINERLIDTVVDICDEEFASEGTSVKCSFNAVTLSPSLKFHYASAKMLPIQPLRLLVPVNYPNCSPILLDKFPEAFRKEQNDLSSEAHSRFSIALRTVSQPTSLMEIARTWDDCARSVIRDYARLLGGGTFSSKFGTLDNWLSVA